jgi:uncharacterized membrane protein YvlD (DUF360 family)
MSELMIFGTICLVIGAIVFAIAVNLSIHNSKGDDERFKEAIGNLCWGAIIASLIVCGSMAIQADKHKTTYEEHCCQTECCEADSTMLNGLK